MITNLIRRLQGRPAPLAPAVARGVADGDDVAVADAIDAQEPPANGPVLRIDDLEQHFLAWALGLDGTPPTHAAACAEPAFAQLQAVAQRFDVRRMPRLPALVPALLSEMRREDVDAASLATVLQRDATLAGDVMRVAGSVHYRRGQPPASLQQAVQAIGHEGLRHVVLSSVMRPILRGDARDPGYRIAARLWTHTEATAWLCGRLAIGQADPGAAQLAGIVAGTGLAALSRMVPQPVLADAATDPAFARRFLDLARPIAGRAGVHWALPVPVLEALDGAAAPAPGLPRLLRAADHLAMGWCLIRDGRIAPDTHWPVDARGHGTPAARDGLFGAMARELEPDDATAA